MQFDLLRLQLLGNLGSAEGRRWLLEMVDAYLADTRAKDAQLSEALAQEDWTLVRSLSHEQKGVSAMLGVEEVAGRFRAIEERPSDQGAVRLHLSAIAATLDRLETEIRAITSLSPVE